jgi:hypothetical protein
MAPSYTVAVLVASLLLACWRPAPWTPPPPPEEARAALGLAAPPDDARPDADEPESEPAPSATTNAEEPAAPSAEAPPGETWTAIVTTAPATVVDDAGKAVCVLHAADARVTVLASDAIRARIRHADCPADGWLQVSMVRRP